MSRWVMLPQGTSIFKVPSRNIETKVPQGVLKVPLKGQGAFKAPSKGTLRYLSFLEVPWRCLEGTLFSRCLEIEVPCTPTLRHLQGTLRKPWGTLKVYWGTFISMWIEGILIIEVLWGAPFQYSFWGTLYCYESSVGHSSEFGNFSQWPI